MIRRHISPILASTPRFFLSWVGWTAAGLLLCGIFWYYQLGDIRYEDQAAVPVHEASVKWGDKP